MSDWPIAIIVLASFASGFGSGVLCTLGFGMLWLDYVCSTSRKAKVFVVIMAIFVLVSFISMMAYVWVFNIGWMVGKILGFPLGLYFSILAMRTPFLVEKQRRIVTR